MAVGNANFDSLLSTTLHKYRSTLEDNVFTSRPFVAFLKRKDKIRMVDGGTKILEQLMYAQNQAAGSYSGYDTLPLTASAGITAAEFEWAQFAATIAISGIEEAKNSGTAQIINLLEAKIQQAEETIAEKFDEMFFSDGTGNSSKDFLGLKVIVESGADVGNIGYSANSWWRSYEENTSAVLTIGQMATAFNTVSRGNDTPDFILTTQTLYEKYESLLQPQQRFQDSVTLDGGFQNLLYKTAPIMFDSYCDTGYMYFLNSKYLKLVGHTRRWFANTPFKLAPNQDARYAQILCYGNLTVSNRARLGKLTAKTAS